MKYFVITLLILSITMPAFAELTSDDLLKISEIVDKSIKASETRMKEHIDIKFETVDERFKSVDKQFEHIDKRITDTRNVVHALIALIIVAIGVPAWRENKANRDQDKINGELRSEIEAIKQHIQNL